jgi:hypothetical protein
MTFARAADRFGHPRDSSFTALAQSRIVFDANVKGNGAEQWVIVRGINAHREQ